MILALLAAAALTNQSPPATAADESILRDAAHAIEAGRLEEARLIIARAISLGFRGPRIERLTADLSFASGNYLPAMIAYQHLTASSEKRAADCERGAISALQLGRVEDAEPFVECAVKAPSASWRAWNASGVFADLKQDWRAADQSFARAHKLAPKEAEVINNQGWSMLLRGDWASAVPYFEEAAAIDPKSERVANNLELARAALGADLPKRRPGESGEDWAKRLNDAGVAAEMLGDKKRAIAAFTQAIDASPIWYDRASNNLKAVDQN